MLTQSRLKELLHYDPATGVFTWKVSRGGVKVGCVAGCICKTTYYWFIKVDGKLYRAHQLAWLYVHGQWPVDEIGHMNHDKADNRITNLREASHMETCQNRSMNSNNTSNATGVYWHKDKQKWCAEIMVNFKKKHLGYFTDKEGAIAARKAAEKRYNFHQNHGKIDI